MDQVQDDRRRGSLLRRPPSEQLVDLHVYIVPEERWLRRRKLARNHVVDYAISAGFIRVVPMFRLAEIRLEIDRQLGHEVVPQDYVFLRSVGRNFTQVKDSQEMDLKAKNFMPPYANEPEIYLKAGRFADHSWSHGDDGGLEETFADSQRIHQVISRKNGALSSPPSSPDAFLPRIDQDKFVLSRPTKVRRSSVSSTNNPHQQLNDRSIERVTTTVTTRKSTTTVEEQSTSNFIQLLRLSSESGRAAESGQADRDLVTTDAERTSAGPEADAELLETPQHTDDRRRRSSVVSGVGDVSTAPGDNRAAVEGRAADSADAQSLSSAPRSTRRRQSIAEARRRSIASALDSDGKLSVPLQQQQRKLSFAEPIQQSEDAHGTTFKDSLQSGDPQDIEGESERAKRHSRDDSAASRGTIREVSHEVEPEAESQVTHEGDAEVEDYSRPEAERDQIETAREDALEGGYQDEEGGKGDGESGLASEPFQLQGETSSSLEPESGAPENAVASVADAQRTAAPLDSTSKKRGDRGFRRSKYSQEARPVRARATVQASSGMSAAPGTSSRVAAPKRASTVVVEKAKVRLVPGRPPGQNSKEVAAEVQEIKEYIRGDRGRVRLPRASRKNGVPVVDTAKRVTDSYRKSDTSKKSSGSAKFAVEVFVTELGEAGSQTEQPGAVTLVGKERNSSRNDDSGARGRSVAPPGNGGGRGSKGSASQRDVRSIVSDNGSVVRDEASGGAGENENIAQSDTTMLGSGKLQDFRAEDADTNADDERSDDEPLISKDSSSQGLQQSTKSVEEPAAEAVNEVEIQSSELLPQGSCQVTAAKDGNDAVATSDVDGDERGVSQSLTENTNDYDAVNGNEEQAEHAEKMQEESSSNPLLLRNARLEGTHNGASVDQNVSDESAKSVHAANEEGNGDLELPEIISTSVPESRSPNFDDAENSTAVAEDASNEGSESVQTVNHQANNKLELPESITTTMPQNRDSNLYDADNTTSVVDDVLKKSDESEHTGNKEANGDPEFSGTISTSMPESTNKNLGDMHNSEVVSQEIANKTAESVRNGNEGATDDFELPETIPTLEMKSEDSKGTQSETDREVSNLETQTGDSPETSSREKISQSPIGTGSTEDATESEELHENAPLKETVTSLGDGDVQNNESDIIQGADETSHINSRTSSGTQRTTQVRNSSGLPRKGSSPELNGNDGESKSEKHLLERDNGAHSAQQEASHFEVGGHEIEASHERSDTAGREDGKTADLGTDVDSASILEKSSTPKDDSENEADRVSISQDSRDHDPSSEKSSSAEKRLQNTTEMELDLQVNEITANTMKTLMSEDSPGDNYDRDSHQAIEGTTVISLPENASKYEEPSSAGSNALARVSPENLDQAGTSANGNEMTEVDSDPHKENDAAIASANDNYVPSEPAKDKEDQSQFIAPEGEQLASEQEKPQDGDLPSQEEHTTKENDALGEESYDPVQNDVQISEDASIYQDANNGSYDRSGNHDEKAESPTLEEKEDDRNDEADSTESERHGADSVPTNIRDPVLATEEVHLNEQEGPEGTNNSPVADLHPATTDTANEQEPEGFIPENSDKQADDENEAVEKALSPNPEVLQGTSPVGEDTSRMEDDSAYADEASTNSSSPTASQAEMTSPKEANESETTDEGISVDELPATRDSNRDEEAASTGATSSSGRGSRGTVTEMPVAIHKPQIRGRKSDKTPRPAQFRALKGFTVVPPRFNFPNHGTKTMVKDDVITTGMRRVRSDGETLNKNQVSRRMLTTPEDTIKGAKLLGRHSGSVNMEEEGLVQITRLQKKLDAVREERLLCEAKREDLLRRAKFLQNKTTATRDQARDMWRRRYAEEKKITPRLEEESSRWRIELERLHRELLSKVEGELRLTGYPRLEQPSNRLSTKIVIAKVLQEIEDLKRRLDYTRISLGAEVRLRTHAERAVKNLREDLLRKKIQVTLTKKETQSVMAPFLRDSFYFVGPI